MGLLSNLFGRGSACSRCGQKSPLTGARSRWDPMGPASAPTGYRCRDCGTALQQIVSGGAGAGGGRAPAPAQAGGPAPASRDPVLDPPEFTPDNSIHMAAEIGDVSRIMRFLASGVSASEPDPIGLQPLHYAANRGHADVMQVLIDHGADPNAQGEQGLAPLHGSAFHGSLEGIKFLVDRGANVNIRTGKGFTPMAIARYRNQHAAAELLRSLGGME